MTESLERLLDRAERLLQRLEALIPEPGVQPNWENATAFRWQGKGNAVPLQEILRPRTLRLDDILCLDRQKAALDINTRQFLHGLPANNALLWGSRGTGKSSLIKAMLATYADRGLRLVEADRQHLAELPDLLDMLHERQERFIVYCDDLSFEADDASYKQLKAVLEGSLSSPDGNVLIYATSNRRHLLPEFQSENQETRYSSGDQGQSEIHFGESVEEKISLSERFGLWLSFHPFSQDEYLCIVRHWLTQLGSPLDRWEDIRMLALRFALERGSRSGRVAWQFARNWVGREQLGQLG
jgi:predicted AAA+ superfamily ATPase